MRRVALAIALPCATGSVVVALAAGPRQASDVQNASVMAWFAWQASTTAVRSPRP